MKRLFLCGVGLCLLLCACREIVDNPKTDTANTPVSSSQEEAASPSSNLESGSNPEPQPAPEPSSEQSEPSSEPNPEPYNDYLVMEKMESIIVGNGYEEGTRFVLSDQEREALWALMDMESWEVATDLPTMGFSSAFYILEEEQVWFFNPFDAQTLIVPSYPDESGKKTSYFASADVIHNILAYTETLTPQSDS